MTEDKAKARWCPYAVVNNGEGRNANRVWDGKRDSAFTTQSRCLASACMAWRWLPAPEPIKSKLEAIRDYRIQHNTDLVTARDAVAAAWKDPDPTEGFCGLAGSPS